MRLKKILFILFVLVLLSIAVAADGEPKKTEAHKDNANQRVEHMKKYFKHKQNIVTQESLQEIYSKAAKYSEDKYKKKYEEHAKKAGETLKEEKAKAYAERIAAEVAYPRKRIWDRGFYSFYDIIDAYEDYSGINKYSALFFGEDWLAKRRKMAADYFCEKTLLLGGKQCWQSKICESYYDNREPPVGRSVLVAQTGIGGYEPGVSIQGERSLPITYKEGGKSKNHYVYKITYFIANPHNVALTYHIKLVGPAKEFTSPAMTIKRATEDEFFRVERLGNNPLISESDNFYHTVCLAFSPRMIAASGRLVGARRVSEICAPLVAYEGAATRPYTTVPDEDLPGGQAAEEEGAPEYEENPLAGA